MSDVRLGSKLTSDDKGIVKCCALRDGPHENPSFSLPLPHGQQHQDDQWKKQQQPNQPTKDHADEETDERKRAGDEIAR